MTQAHEVKVGHKIRYNHNGNIYDGTVVVNNNGNITVIENNDKAGWQLWNAGYAVGTCIVTSQIVYHPTNQMPRN